MITLDDHKENYVFSMKNGPAHRFWSVSNEATTLSSGVCQHCQHTHRGDRFIVIRKPLHHNKVTITKGN